MTICVLALFQGAMVSSAGIDRHKYSLIIHSYLTQPFDTETKIVQKNKSKCCYRERSGSVVECLTQNQRAAGSILTGITALCL